MIAGYPFSLSLWWRKYDSCALCSTTHSTALSRWLSTPHSSARQCSSLYCPLNFFQDANVNRNYLVGYLHRVLLLIVRCIPLASKNYRANNVLEKIYQNPRLITTSHWPMINNTHKITTTTKKYIYWKSLNFW